jgi:nucleotide-binding universal stress UspA family protein
MRKSPPDGLSSSESVAMIRVTHVLCPVDFSEISRRALDHAAALADWYEARLTVLNVFPVMPVMDVPPLVLDDKIREEITGQLRRFTATVPSTVPLELRVEQADLIHEGIREQVASGGVDLLVIGSHGRSGVKRLLLGSVAERVIRHASCPTMIVPARAHDVVPQGPVRYRTILCPVDFSEHSIRAVEYAVNLAEESDAELRLLHVVSLPAELKELEPSFESLRGRIEADRLDRLNDLIPAEAASYCTVRTAISQGTVHREILAAAAEQPADLIVMGAQGRSALDTALFGSNTARVTRAALCPVLVVG